VESVEKNEGGSVMKKKRAQIMKVIFVLSAMLPLAAFSAADVSADFYVIAGSQGVGTEIRSLPYTISSSGFYYITKDLSCEAGSHGITINVDNVTVDLMGFSLVGPGGTGDDDGIYMMGRENVGIRNGTVRNFNNCGIRDSAVGAGHHIFNIRVKDNASIGICLHSRSNIIKNCTAVKNGSHGIYAGVGSTIIGNTCSGNTDHGIYLRDYSLVDQNSAYNNGTNMNSATGCVFGKNVAP